MQHITYAGIVQTRLYLLVLHDGTAHGTMARWQKK